MVSFFFTYFKLHKTGVKSHIFILFQCQAVSKCLKFYFISNLEKVNILVCLSSSFDIVHYFFKTILEITYIHIK